MQSLTITAPDDWHIHLRDGDALERTVNDAARQFKRAICMPNLVPPITTAAQAFDYKARILQALDPNLSFTPLMTLYLTDHTPAEEVQKAFDLGVTAVKVYPAGATTNSHGGVTNLLKLDSVFDVLQKTGMPLLLHGEVVDADVDIFDREKVFIDRTLSVLIERYPDLKIVFEHITTKDAAQFVTEASENIAATITPQHLMFNRNDMLVGGIRPHLYCLPVLKRTSHQNALVKAAISGNKKFFIGTDSAPHARVKKEAACGCAGCYSAPYALAMYATIFEESNALDRLESFLSFNGPDFYNLPRNSEKITLIRDALTIPYQLSYPDGGLVPLSAGTTLNWRLLDE